MNRKESGSFIRINQKDFKIILVETIEVIEWM